jgi:hypothetical protein
MNLFITSLGELMTSDVEMQCSADLQVAMSLAHNAPVLRSRHQHLATRHAHVPWLQAA